MGGGYSQAQLVASGQLSIEDLDKIKTYRRKHNRLGFTYQLVYVRLFNYFPQQKPFDLIDEIIAFVALQLNINQQLMTEYTKYRQPIARHQMQIRRYLNLSLFSEDTSKQLRPFIVEEAQRIELMTLLLVKAKHYLRQNKILQPSEDTLQRLIVSQREQARQFIFKKLMALIDDTLCQQLEGLLLVDESHFSSLHSLKRPPAAPSTQALLNLAHKLKVVQATKALEINITWLNNNYQRSLAKYVHRCSAHRLRKLQPSHKYTALICFLWQISRDTVDFMVDMFFKLVNRIYAQAEYQMHTQLQQQRKNIKVSLAMLKTIGAILLDNTVMDAELRNEVFNQIKRKDLEAQIETAEPLLTGTYSHVFQLVTRRFAYLRRFAPVLLEHLYFERESQSSEHLLQAITLLRELNSQHKRKMPKDAPLDFIPTKLQNMVAPQGNIDKRAWECALLTTLRDEIRAGNLSVKDSKRYGHFSDFFISNQQWQHSRSHFFHRAGLPQQPAEVADYLQHRLNAAYDKFLAKQPDNRYAHVENDRWVLSVDPAETFNAAEIAGLKTLRAWLAKKIRSIKLPQLLIEVDNDLHFTEKFKLPSQPPKREADDICAILVTLMSHGCFIGAYTMARLTKGVSYEQIRRITDWQLTEEAQPLALAVIVNAIANLDVTRHWGLGKTSSSDAQRFEYKRKSLQQTYSTKFRDFALEFYTFVADNYAPYFSMPIECTDRDAPYVLDGLLYNESDLMIEEHFTDTHGFTEINFAAFAMLGKKFSPRIKGIQRQRIYRIDANKEYGALTPLVSANNRLIHMDWIVEHWDRMGQFYASLESGHSTASTALKRLTGFSEKNHFYRANRELGRIFKTENILDYMADPLLRQQRRRGLLKGEQIHQLARDVAYGKRGKINGRNVQEQKNTCSCLTLILASIIYWQAKEIKQVIDTYSHELEPACLAMLAHVSPIGWDNVLLYGEYILDRSWVK